MKDNYLLKKNTKNKKQNKTKNKQTNKQTNKKNSQIVPSVFIARR